MQQITVPNVHTTLDFKSHMRILLIFSMTILNIFFCFSERFSLWIYGSQHEIQFLT
jgi:hypothetical protein